MRIRDPGWRQFGSGIRDGDSSDPGSGINIPDPQHWGKVNTFLQYGLSYLGLTLAQYPVFNIIYILKF
jgi:hypothetical protein